MSVTVNVNNLYAYTGSLASLQVGILGTNRLNAIGTSKSGTIVSNNGVLSSNESTSTTVSIAGGWPQELTYLGSGTASVLSLLGIELFSRRVVIFSVGDPTQMYIYAPNSLPSLSELLVNFNINPNTNYTLAGPSNGDVYGLDVGQNMPLGYQDAQGDRITKKADKIFGNGGNDTIRAASCNDSVFGDAGNDVLYGDSGNDTLFGGTGADTIYDGTGLDTLTGGLGADVIVASGDAYLNTDFDATSGVGDTDSTNNDYVDLALFYNTTTLAAWNAANPTKKFKTPLELLRFDQKNNGIFNQTGDLQIQNSGVAVNSFTMTTENTGIICFATGARISTPNGMVAVEDLSVGDLVLTSDNGFKKIRWIGCRKLAYAELQRNDMLLPVRIRAGAMGNGLPERDLVVTRQHRVLIKSPIAETMFGDSEVLIPAKDLRGLDGIETLSISKGIEYWHILFDEHQLIFSENMRTESFFLGPQAVLMLRPAAIEELRFLFPDLEKVYASLARLEIRDHKAWQFVKRVSSKNQTVIDQSDIQNIKKSYAFQHSARRFVDDQ
ncbi:Hemolysin-type calcium-binding repeat-containing protein [Pseudorhodobacter antarcticus]|uniref:Hemolysin-type calcium-binding repeat-containing protein n=1 Tax=Pseudorhodobacter antarcticus TaxID=1077947 RepID=A0A1H8NCR4_9RHOB|nr:Hint domain-containing protein [Pseudorhodobacter antarcticus]SEO27336.1 Hemolysin-type calcium-binding repeat-containing protein [Pseudorhodobacter antarcticus]